MEGRRREKRMEEGKGKRIDRKREKEGKEKEGGSGGATIIFHLLVSKFSM